MYRAHASPQANVQSMGVPTSYCTEHARPRKILYRAHTSPQATIQSTCVPRSGDSANSGGSREVPARETEERHGQGILRTRAASGRYRQERQKNATGNAGSDAATVPMVTWERGSDVSGKPDTESTAAVRGVIGVARS
ncbi:hypothetical protein NDU88_000054 [Pleurodeles waltl]|uniref:Uncharacterized protein n=1 Tax=Pleurodeles waltl TaxID=8319 RepID=A0AAV7LVV4_PLEWA|nr:hypothetical protein NDU88_000054 [Pleurodeles waltl]